MRRWATSDIERTMALYEQYYLSADTPRSSKLARPTSQQTSPSSRQLHSRPTSSSHSQATVTSLRPCLPAPVSPPPSTLPLPPSPFHRFQHLFQKHDPHYHPPPDLAVQTKVEFDVEGVSFGNSEDPQPDINTAAFADIEDIEYSQMTLPLCEEEEEEEEMGEEESMGVGVGQFQRKRKRQQSQGSNGGNCPSSIPVPDFLELDLPDWGREGEKIFYYEIDSYKSKRKTTTLPGRVWFDSLTFAKKANPKESHKLKDLAEAHMPKEESPEYKQDLHWRQIVPKFQGTEEDRAELASYCLQDSICVCRLLEVRFAYMKCFASARGSYMTMQRYLYSTAQAQDYNIFVARGLQEGIFVPWYRAPVCEYADYKGGKVFEVKAGFYEFYVMTLDFTSLYPTTMIAHHLCPTNFVEEREIGEGKRYKEEEVEKCVIFNDDGTVLRTHHFLRRDGLTAKILRSGISTRNFYKGKLKEAKARGDKGAIAAYDSAQDAEKLKLNTTYGMNGGSVRSGGLLSFHPVAESTTAWGRWHILDVKRQVEEFYPQIVVLGGDTDSVIIYVKMERPDDEAVLRLGLEIVQMINKTLPPPMSLAFENAFTALLYSKKKNYAGTHQLVAGDKFVIPRAPDDMKVKGLQAIRGDNPPIIGDVQWHTMRAMFNVEPFVRQGCVIPPPAYSYYKDKETAASRVIAVLSLYAHKIARDEIPLEGYAISVKLSKSEYQGNVPHAVVVKKIRLRGDPDAPQVGDKVTYFWVQQNKKCVPMDAVEIRRRGVPIDRVEYLRQFKHVHFGLFDKVVAADVLDGHLSKIVVQPTKVSASNPFFKNFMINK